MRRCKICNVPLEGILGNIARSLFKVRVSSQGSDTCNKCEGQKSAPPIQGARKGKYRCQICDREIDENVALAHVKAEEYLLGLIKKDHPQWKEDQKTCHRCIEYYRQLVKKTEI
ncbi:MAG: hypothetical protein V1674_06070 [Candidatus Omnitrophota bacterium]